METSDWLIEPYNFTFLQAHICFTSLGQHVTVGQYSTKSGTVQIVLKLNGCFNFWLSF